MNQQKSTKTQSNTHWNRFKLPHSFSPPSPSISYTWQLSQCPKKLAPKHQQQVLRPARQHRQKFQRHLAGFVHKEVLTASHELHQLRGRATQNGSINGKSSSHLSNHPKCQKKDQETGKDGLGLCSRNKIKRVNYIQLLLYVKIKYNICISLYIRSEWDTWWLVVIQG